MYGNDETGTCSESFSHGHFVEHERSIKTVRRHLQLTSDLCDLTLPILQDNLSVVFTIPHFEGVTTTDIETGTGIINKRSNDRSSTRCILAEVHLYVQ